MCLVVQALHIQAVYINHHQRLSSQFEDETFQVYRYKADVTMMISS